MTIKTFYSRYRKLMHRRWKSRLFKKIHTKREFILISSDVLEKHPCKSAFFFMPLGTRNIWLDFHGQELPINCDFFLELKPLLLIFFSILKLWVNKRTSSNSRLNQDQSNHFIANAEHFEIFGRKGKRNSVEHKRYQSDNISENVILTRKSLQIAMLLISPYLKDI